MIIDCDQCSFQHSSTCDDCVVSMLLHPVYLPVELASVESVALGNLAAGGLVSPLRLAPVGNAMPVAGPSLDSGVA